ncbi:hypothetical protein BKA64DRAFT_590854, partial [Cadophora sp. MPI-SDFR-AT-0126]
MIEDGSSADSASPCRDLSHPPPSSRSKRSKSASKQPWTENTTFFSPSSGGTSTFASIRAQTSRPQAPRSRPRKSSPATAQASRDPPHGPLIFGRNASFKSSPTRDGEYDIIMQPLTTPISQDQLVAEAEGIYAGLVTIEAKCIEGISIQARLTQTADSASQPKMRYGQWKWLFMHHRSLLHKYHDFFLISQHPSASPDLRRLAFTMPARMWRHGIHPFLEFLRHRLPASLDHILAFIYFAYSMMTLLYETVPVFEGTWIEFLGDLGRYRMAIEDDDIRDREVWTGVARQWYSKGSEKAPITGRLYHHLAILARPNALQQLFYYAKSLCVVIPYTLARESILTLFEPVLNSNNALGQYRLPSLDTAFVKAHGLLFTNRDIEKFDLAVKEFLSLLDNQIGRVTKKFMEQGYYIAVANSVAMLSFASKDNPVIQAMTKNLTGEADVDITGNDSPAVKSFERAKYLSNETLEIVLHRIGDPNVLPFIHVTLVYVYYLAKHPLAIKLLEASFPWQSMTVMLNTLLALYSTQARIESTDFPLPIKDDDIRPVPEDFAMRGLLWADGYYPKEWFASDKIDDAEKYLEKASMTDDRKERILWLACRIASLGDWINYDSESKRFSVPSDKPQL